MLIHEAIRHIDYCVLNQVDDLYLLKKIDLHHDERAFIPTFVHISKRIQLPKH